MAAAGPTADELFEEGINLEEDSDLDFPEDITEDEKQDRISRKRAEAVVDRQIALAVKEIFLAYQEQTNDTDDDTPPLSFEAKDAAEQEAIEKLHTLFKQFEITHLRNIFDHDWWNGWFNQRLYNSFGSFPKEDFYALIARAVPNTSIESVSMPKCDAKFVSGLNGHKLKEFHLSYPPFYNIPDEKMKKNIRKFQDQCRALAKLPTEKLHVATMWKPDAEVLAIHLAGSEISEVKYTKDSKRQPAFFHDLKFLEDEEGDAIFQRVMGQKRSTVRETGKVISQLTSKKATSDITPLIFSFLYHDSFQEALKRGEKEAGALEKNRLQSGVKRHKS
jgi:hypothetical protein